MEQSKIICVLMHKYYKLWGINVYICEFPQIPNGFRDYPGRIMTWRNNSSTRYPFGESGAKNIAGNYKIFPVVARYKLLLLTL